MRPYEIIRPYEKKRRCTCRTCLERRKRMSEEVAWGLAILILVVIWASLRN